jgi:hypothetical protein
LDSILYSQRIHSIDLVNIDLNRFEKFQRVSSHQKRPP